MRAVIVSVDYGDFLALTLPFNRRHFSDVLVVTTERDAVTVEVALHHGCDVHVTDAFYRGGADFNKWLALEEGLDWFGRDGWLTLLDADVVLPREFEGFQPSPGYLYSPLRRMWLNPTGVVPLQEDWKSLPLFEDYEHAGYTQTFHCADPVLGPGPWHETNWRHAGGADSFFQQRWPVGRRTRPAFEVLHLGPAGANWCGRVTPTLDGTMPPTDVVTERSGKLRAYRRGRVGVPAADRYRHEKL